LIRTTYVFHERDDNLALCPISHFIALALADNAFAARGIQSATDIFRIEVPAHRNGLQVKWKPEIFNVPIFRRTIRTAQGIIISPNKALAYDTFNQYLQRLGRNSGFQDKLTPYSVFAISQSGNPIRLYNRDYIIAPDYTIVNNRMAFNTTRTLCSM
jgi:hypothetical protein